jgi:hypothetical protein
MAKLTAVTKSELARHIGKTPQYISKLVKQGMFDKCMTPDGKKIYLEKALEAMTKGRKRGFAPPIAPPKNAAEDPAIYNEESVKELEELLSEAVSPSQKVQIVKDFWAGKIARQRFLQAEGELIAVSDAKAAVEKLLTPYNKALDDLPVQLKSHFPEIPTDAVEWLIDYINTMKIEARKQLDEATA